MTEVECGNRASHVVYWPGKDPLPMCLDHHAYMQKIAAAMGLYVRTEQADNGAVCTNKVTCAEAPE